MRCKPSSHLVVGVRADLSSGGGNGMSVFPTGVHFDVPVVDGDAMGRAYPTMYHGKFPRTGWPDRYCTNRNSHFQRLRVLPHAMCSF